MKKKVLILSLVFLLLPRTLTILADNNSTDLWKIEKEILIETDSEYKSLMLDKEVYRYAKEDLSDLRIIDEQNEFVPYYMDSYEEEIIRTDRQLIYLSENLLTFQKEEDTYVDFKLQTDNQQKDFIVDQLDLQFDLNVNFAKEVRVYGSYDNEKWDLVQQDSIFNIADENRSKTSVYFDSEMKYNFYRIAILQNIEDIQLQSLVAVQRGKMTAEQKDFVVEEIPNYEIIEKPRQTTISIANPNKLKVNQIQIIAADRFNREYELYVKEDSLYTIGSINSELGGNIIRLQDTYSRNNLENIKLIIDNKDDQPIKIDEVRMSYTVDKVVFKSEMNQDYRIVVGNESANAPYYDIRSYKQTIADKQKEPVVFGDTLKKESFGIDSNEHNTELILNIVVILTSIFLIFIILRKTKKDS